MTGLIDALYRRILLAAHPVGSLYQSTVSTSPAELFGGTWVILNDVFLLAAGSHANAGTFGGEAKHKLTTAELPAIEGEVKDLARQSSDVNISVNGVFSRFLSGSYTGYGSGVEAGSTYDSIRMSFGGNQPHNNMPPYYAVYMWRRTA